MLLTQEIISFALALGFDLAGIAPVGPPPHRAAFDAWLERAFHGEMSYLAERADVRRDPLKLAPGARSAIVLAASYAPGPLSPGSHDRSSGRIARYAWGTDYHEVIKSRLYSLDAFIRQQTGRQAPGRACVDTAPLLERDLGFLAGLGFYGRNTCLIAPGLGSWTFLAALLVPEELEGKRGAPGLGREHAGAEPTSYVGCGRCTRCLDQCPTHAFSQAYVLDARRCLSYLTIELRGPIPRELRPLMDAWVFGCDVCQEVCPYNRFAPGLTMSALAPDASRAAVPLEQLLTLDEDGFRARFRGTAILRAKRRGLVRNACVAAGNAQDKAAVPLLASLLSDPEPLIRGHAAWALGRLGGPAAGRALRDAGGAAAEPDAYVREEIAFALTMI